MESDDSDHDRLIRVEDAGREASRRLDDVESKGSDLARTHEGRLTRLEEDVKQIRDSLRSIAWRGIAGLLSAVTALGGVIARFLLGG